MPGRQSGIGGAVPVGCCPGHHGPSESRAGASQSAPSGAAGHELASQAAA